jgi:glycosyltransferase involved in cell wall biosynthesis
LRWLFLTSRSPWPERRGDQARTAGLVGELARRHRVHVLAQQWPDLLAAPPPDLPSLSFDSVRVSWPAIARAMLRGAPSFLTGRRPLQVAIFDQPVYLAAVRRCLDAFRPDAVAVMLSRLADVLPVLGELPVVLDLVDALSLNMEQRARRQAMSSGFWRAEARRFVRWDRRLMGRVDRATVVAERDRQALLGSGEAPSWADRLWVVPFGVALPARPAWLDVEANAAPRTDSPPTVVLAGNLGYFPTVDGARWFADRVWPAVRRELPTARWCLAGARPAQAVRALARLPGVELIADPPDLRAVVRRASVAIAPLHAGSGTPIKILEAMADGVPVVATPAARRGLDDLPEGALAVASEPAEFARRLVELFAPNEPARQAAREQAICAWRWLDGRHRLERTAETFEQILLEAVAQRRGPTRAADTVRNNVSK